MSEIENDSQDKEETQAPSPSAREYIAVSVFWLAVCFFWGALLLVVLQSRVQSAVELEMGNASRTLIEARVASRFSLLAGTGALIAAVTQIVAGAFSDSLSTHGFLGGRRKPFVLFGTVFACAAIAMLPFVHAYAGVFFVFVLIQLFLNIATGPYQALMPEIIPATHHGTAAAWMGGLALIGRTGGMVLGSQFMRETWGLSALTIIFIVSLLGLMSLTLVLVHEPPGHARPVSESLSTLAPAAIWRGLRGEPNFAWLVASRFVINTGVYTMLPFLLFYLINVFGLTRDAALAHQGILALIVNLAGLMGNFPAGRASDKFPKKFVVATTCALCVAGGLAFAVSGNVTYAAIAAGVFGLGYGAFQAVDWAFVCSVMPRGEVGKSMGVWGLADTLPQIVAPLVGGAFAAPMIRTFGAADGYRAVMLLAVTWFALGAAFIFKVNEPRRSANM